jgi:hypothetical protein
MTGADQIAGAAQAFTPAGYETEVFGRSSGGAAWRDYQAPGNPNGWHGWTAGSSQPAIVRFEVVR